MCFYHCWHNETAPAAIHVAQVVPLLPDTTSTHLVARRFAVSPTTISRDSRRSDVTWEELVRATKWHQTSSRTSICPRSTAGGLEKDLQQDQNRTIPSLMWQKGKGSSCIMKVFISLMALMFPRFESNWESGMLRASKAAKKHHRVPGAHQWPDLALRGAWSFDSVPEGLMDMGSINMTHPHYGTSLISLGFQFLMLLVWFWKQSSKHCWFWFPMTVVTY